jgi:hypothetical protein
MSVFGRTNRFMYSGESLGASQKRKFNVFKLHLLEQILQTGQHIQHSSYYHVPVFVHNKT